MKWEPPWWAKYPEDLRTLDLVCEWNSQGLLILELADSGESPERIMDRARKARDYLHDIIDRHDK